MPSFPAWSHTLAWIPDATSLGRYRNDRGVDALVRRRASRCISCRSTEVQDLRSRHIGKIIVDLTRDRQWSQYCCCMTVANHDVAEENPVATRRAMRALFKA